MSRVEVLESSEKIAKKLFALKDFKDSTKVMFYASKGNEVHTLDMIQDSINLGKRVFVPVTDTLSKELMVCELRDVGELEPKAFGVPEPKAEYFRPADAKQLELVIVPGIAFDLNGHRIGYGKGYYDKFLKRLPRGTKRVGLAFEFQVVDRIPREAHDQRLHKIVTDKKVRLASEGK